MLKLEEHVNRRPGGSRANLENSNLMLKAQETLTDLVELLKQERVEPDP